MEGEFLKDSKIGIVGVGMVGGALERYFGKITNKIFVYDKGRGMGSMDEVNKADIIFMCVPTPFDKNKGFDLSYIEDACAKVDGEKIIVIKSTVLPGTTETLQNKYPKHRFLFNPEFLVEATADYNMNHPERQIVGYTKESQSLANDLISILPSAPFKKAMPVTEAEMVKYFGNTWLALKVSFANQMFDLCQKLEIDYDTVKDSAAADSRIGNSHLDVLHSGYRGYGGKCLPKDIKALIQLGDFYGVDLKLHKTAEEINSALMKAQDIEDPEKFIKK
jgi:UDPglucose 6-dehydrogenase